MRDIRVAVRTKCEIAVQMRRLAERVDDAKTIDEIETWLSHEVGQLECDVINRAVIERGEIEP